MTNVSAKNLLLSVLSRHLSRNARLRFAKTLICQDSRGVGTLTTILLPLNPSCFEEFHPNVSRGLWYMGVQHLTRAMPRNLTILRIDTLSLH